jgi:hypothetical protein
MTLKDANMNKQCTADKRKHVTLTIPQKLQIIRGLDSDESQREVMALYNVGLSTVCDIQKQKDLL